MKVGVPYSSNNQEVEDMDIDETDDNATSYEDTVMDASGDFNMSHDLVVLSMTGSARICKSLTHTIQ